MSEFRRCIYCGNVKNIRNFRSVEHVWPRSLGADKLPDLFMSDRVCDACNHMCGLWVDGAFIKSWIIASERMASDLLFLNPEKPGPVSLAFLGQLPEFPAEPGWVCERWLGPSGEHIYHVRQHDDPAWDTYTGGSPKKQRRQNNGGRAYIRLTADDEFWLLTAMSSFHRHFRNSRRFCLANVTLIDDRWRPIFPEPDFDDPKVHEEVAYIEGQIGPRFAARAQIDVGFADRFVCKLALGLGANLIGDAHIDSTYAEALRNALREADYGKRASLKILGTGFRWGGPDEAMKGMLRYSGGWVVNVVAIMGELAAFIVHPNGHVSSVKISENVALPRELVDRFRLGEIYVAVPSVGEFIGPLSLAQYLNHQHGGRQNDVLQRIDQMKRSVSDLPPRRQPRNGEEQESSHGLAELS